MKTGLFLFVLCFICFGGPSPDPWLQYDRMSARYPDEAAAIENLRKENVPAAGAKLEMLIQLDAGRMRAESSALTAAARKVKADPSQEAALRDLVGKKYDRMTQEKIRLEERLKKQIESLRKTGAAPGVIAREQANLNRVSRNKPGRAENRQEYIEKTVRKLLSPRTPRKKGKVKIQRQALRTDTGTGQTNEQ